MASQTTNKVKYIYVFCDINNPAMLKVGDAYDVIDRFHGETCTASAISGQYRLLKIWKSRHLDILRVHGRQL